MRRHFLRQTMIGGAIFLGGNTCFAADIRTVEGDWHLLAVNDDEINVPQHRMDMRFRNNSGALTGAIVSRNDASEIALASAGFEGSTLHFQMEAPAGRTQAEMPTMIMTWNGNRFEGSWTSASGEKTGPVLKLVKARTAL